MTGSGAEDGPLGDHETAADEDDPAVLQRAILARLEPEGVSSDGGGWQQRKSAQTRISILEAAIRCLAERGYAHTTTKIVASMAGVSRGAMLHHYPTKRDLVEQATAYTFLKRMERNFEQVRKLTERERANEMAGLTVYWRNLHTVEYHAYLELCVAARSDEELREILEPKALEFEQIQFSELPKAFPEWEGIPAELTLATDLVIASMDGLLINHVKWRDSNRAENVRKLVRKVLLLLRMGKIKIEDL